MKTETRGRKRLNNINNHQTTVISFYLHRGDRDTLAEELGLGIDFTGADLREFLQSLAARDAKIRLKAKRQAKRLREEIAFFRRELKDSAILGLKGDSPIDEVADELELLLEE